MFQNKYETLQFSSIVAFFFVLTVPFTTNLYAQEENEDLKKRVKELEDNQEKLRKTLRQLREQNEMLRDQLKEKKEIAKNETSPEQPEEHKGAPRTNVPEGVDPKNELLSYKTDGSGFLRFQSRDGDFSARFGGRLMFDYLATDVAEDIRTNVESATGDPDAVESGAEIRRARLFTSGSYKDIGYKLQIDFAGGSSIKDAYLDFPSPIPSGYSLKVGRFYEPWSLEGQTSSKYLTGMEFPLPVSTFYSFRTNGVGAWGSLLDKRLHWGASVTRSQTDGQGDSREEGGYAASARLSGVPYLDEKDNHLLHIGLSGSSRGITETRFAATPEIANLESFADTGTFNADRRNVLDLEGILQLDEFSLQGEYIHNSLDRPSGGTDPVFDGYYLMAGYWLTGEHSNFSLKKGKWGRPKPNKSLFEGGWGAWQLMGRYSTLDLNDAGIIGGKMDNITAGFNWWLNAHTKIALNYIHSDLEDGVSGAEGDNNLLGMRYQIDF